MTKRIEKATEASNACKVALSHYIDMINAAFPDTPCLDQNSKDDLIDRIIEEVNRDLAHTLLNKAHDLFIKNS